MYVNKTYNKEKTKTNNYNGDKWWKTMMENVRVDVRIYLGLFI